MTFCYAMCVTLKSEFVQRIMQCSSSP